MVTDTDTQFNSKVLCILYVRYIGTSFSLHNHQRHWDACAYTCDVLERFVTPQSVAYYNYKCCVYNVPGTFPVLLDMHACVVTINCHR